MHHYINDSILFYQIKKGSIIFFIFPLYIKVTKPIYPIS